MKLIPHSCAILALGIAGSAFAAPMKDTDQVISALNEAGYASVRDVELDDGLWEAEVQRDNGDWHDVHVIPESGAVLDKHAEGTLLEADAIRQKLEMAGFTNIHDVDRDEAVFDVDATDPDGRSVEVRVNGFTGEVLATDLDD